MSKKTENANNAKNWVAAIEGNPSLMEWVNKAVEKTAVYKNELVTDSDRSYCRDSRNFITCTRINANKTFEEIQRQYMAGEEHVCVLNFASYFNPGGGFLNGAYTQEESLCANSVLYPILSRLPIYEERKTSYCRPEYNNQVLYTPNVHFYPYEEAKPGRAYMVDVISCAAPNCNRISMGRKEQYMAALEKRIEAIYLIPYLHGTEVLILGSWGCGVFKNDPGLISSMFAKVMSQYPMLYKKVIYACGGRDNMEIFARNIRAE